VLDDFTNGMLRALAQGIDHDSRGIIGIGQCRLIDRVPGLAESISSTASGHEYYESLAQGKSHNTYTPD
jgi:hypothetical protein